MHRAAQLPLALIREWGGGGGIFMQQGGYFAIRGRKFAYRTFYYTVISPAECVMFP
jgi:hypothetical protein